MFTRGRRLKSPVSPVSPALLSRPRQECARGCESCQVPVLGLSELLTRLPKPSAGEGFGVAPKARGLAGGGSRGSRPLPPRAMLEEAGALGRCGAQGLSPALCAVQKRLDSPRPRGKHPRPKVRGRWAAGAGVGGRGGSGGIGFRLRAVHCPRSRGE